MPKAGPEAGIVGRLCEEAPGALLVLKVSYNAVYDS